jgi:hypothetical protein
MATPRPTLPNEVKAPTREDLKVTHQMTVVTAPAADNLRPQQPYKTDSALGRLERQLRPHSRNVVGRNK